MRGCFDRQKGMIVAKCFGCGKTEEVPCTPAQWETAQTVPIQCALPNLSAGERELLISGLCERCYESIFENMPEDD